MSTQRPAGGPIANRIDHVVIEAADEQQLFSFFTDVLGLAVAWPVAQWGFISEGGVSVGNANLGCNRTLDPNSDPTPQARAIAFEPAAPLPAIVDELHARGLAPTEPMASGPLDLPGDGPFAPWQRGWTNVMVLGGPLSPLPFVCAYDHDVAERARAERARFDAGGGGPLGIVELRAVVVHADDVESTAAEWDSLLGPGSIVRPGVLALSTGPELRVEAGDAAPALVFGVASVGRALTAARGLGIARAAGEHVRLEPADVLGLDLRLE